MDPAERKRLKVAFLLGFMVTREGFNDECPYEHCAEGFEPSDRRQAILERLLQLATYSESSKLLNDYAQQAIAYIEGLHDLAGLKLGP